MAIYDNLPVFKDTYDLLLLFIRISANMQRDFRYTIGQELKKELMDLCISIYQANGTTEKEFFINEGRKRMVIVKLDFRILHDTHQISTKQFAMFADKAEAISKQLTAWNNYIKKQGKKDA
uniref:four helix bundle protein n=1 Tax=uncultured Bacteroides sp. TaxID=162156 RepID=UPI0025EA0980|nr:four helix bundle protein [uncultured Bacteroides sp.]